MTSADAAALLLADKRIPEEINARVRLWARKHFPEKYGWNDDLRGTPAGSEIWNRATNATHYAGKYAAAALKARRAGVSGPVAVTRAQGIAGVDPFEQRHITGIVDEVIAEHLDMLRSALDAYGAG